jgi:hypothetical protein
VSEFVAKWSKNCKGPPKETAIEMQRASFRLLQNFPPSLAAAEKKTGALPIPLDKLYQSKSVILLCPLPSSPSLTPLALRDKTLQKLLLAATETLPPDHLHRQTSSEEEELSPAIARSCFCRDELKQRLDSKSPLGSYMARVFDTSAVFMVANIWTVKYLFFHLLSTTQLLFDKEHHISSSTTASGRQKERFQHFLLREACDTAELISLLAKYLPLVPLTSPPPPALLSHRLVRSLKGAHKILTSGWRVSALLFPLKKLRVRLTGSRPPESLSWRISEASSSSPQSISSSPVSLSA